MSTAAASVVTRAARVLPDARRQTTVQRVQRQGEDGRPHQRRQEGGGHQIGEVADEQQDPVEEQFTKPFRPWSPHSCVLPFRPRSHATPWRGWRVTTAADPGGAVL